MDCISDSDVPLIVVQEPTIIAHDDMAMQMDTLPPLDQVPNDLFSPFQIPEVYFQQIPTEAPVAPVIDAQVPDVVMTSGDEKEYFHISKKKRNAPNALNKKRKNTTLYDHIVDFDYETLKTIEEEEEEEFEKHKQEQTPWTTLVGRVRSLDRFRRVCSNCC